MSAAARSDEADEPILVDEDDIPMLDVDNDGTNPQDREPSASVEPSTNLDESGYLLAPVPRITPVKPRDPDSKAFKDKYVLSVDGERYDPGYGIICEVHRGLGKFVADMDFGTYIPTNLRKESHSDKSMQEIEEDQPKTLDEMLAELYTASFGEMPLGAPN
jgi:hypothetical protein